MYVPAYAANSKLQDFKKMAANAHCEEEWMLQPEQEFRQSNKDRSGLVLEQTFIPPGDHHLNL